MREKTPVSKSTKKIDYNRRIKLCKALGAETFQKIVFAAEKVKFKILKKCFPNFLSFYEKRCDKANKKSQKKAKSELEKKRLNTYYQQQKLLMRKEWNQEQNRNYHIDRENPVDFLNYLRWNKEIHVKGMAKNMVFLPVCIGFVCAGFGWVALIGAYELFSVIVNFECVNIQNYNIFRIKQREEQLKKVAEKRQERDSQRYKEASELICHSLAKSETKIPSLTEIINSIKTPQQLNQMRAFLTATSNNSQVQDQIKITSNSK